MGNRVDGPTPNGGDYSEIFFFDADGNEVGEEQAVRCIIRECRANGELIQETYGIVSKA